MPPTEGVLRMWQLITRRMSVRTTIALVSLATCSGCGGDAPPAEQAQKSQQGDKGPSTTAAAPLPPVAAISTPRTAEITPAPAPEGSPEAALQRIAELIVEANAQARQAKADVEA